MKRALLLLIVAGALCWGGLSWRGRSVLGISQHLQGNVHLPFAPLGPPALHPDGRAFVVAAGWNLLSVAEAGQLLWSRRLPGPVLPRPVLLLSQGGDLLLVQGGGQVFGYSLGGELRFSRGGAGAGEWPPLVDERGRFYVLDERGGLAGFDAEGRGFLRVELGLSRGRGVVLADGRLLLVGAAAVGESGEVVLCRADGQVEVRLPLQVVPVGLSVSARPGEVALLGSGAEVLGLGPRGEIVRRLLLPGPVVSDPVPGEGEEVAVLVARGRERVLVLIGARQLETSLGGVAPVLVRGRGGRYYAPFDAPGGLLPDHAGVVSVGADTWRQPLPGAAASLGRSPGDRGAVVATVAGEPYLWRFEP